MINSVMTPESILENFKSVIESARMDYKSNNLHSEMLESIDLSSEVTASLVSGEDDRLDEAINVTDAKIVREKKGTAISVKVNGTEYRYVSATKSTADLYRSFMGQLKHANAGYKALNWLKKNALEYYGSKNPSPEAKKLVGMDESVISTAAALSECDKDKKKSTKILKEATQPSDVPPSTADDEKDELKKPVNEAVSPSSEVIRTDKTGMSYYDDFLNVKDHDYKRLAKGLQGEIVYMTPQEYIRRLGTDIFHCSYERVMRGVDHDNVQNIMDKMSSGTKYNLPILDLANETQEGRHRALAADKLGVKKIPVLVVTKWDPHKELKMPKSMNLWYGHTIEWTRKDGTPGRETVGLDLEKVRKKVQEIIKSGDYKK